MRATAYVHLYVPYHNAGGETTLHDILKGMVCAGWDVDVILSRPMEGYDLPYEVDGVKVFPFTDKRQPVRAANKSQLFITHLDNSERTAVLGKQYRVPVVHLVHNDMDATKRYLALRSDLAVFNTEWVANSHTQYKGVKTVLHPMIDFDKYSQAPTEDREYITLVNLWNGGGHKYQDGKGSDIFYEMAKRFPREKFMGVIGGYGEQDIRELPNVVIHPHTADIVNKVYGKSKLMLMPSRYESFGRVAIEAACAGIPTVASPTPGLREALGAEYALYADPANLDAWEAKIREALDGRKKNTHAKRATDRALYWSNIQQEELNQYLHHVERLGEQTLRMRGW